MLHLAIFLQTGHIVTAAWLLHLQCDTRDLTLRSRVSGLIWRWTNPDGYHIKTSLVIIFSFTIFQLTNQEEPCPPHLHGVLLTPHIPPGHFLFLGGTLSHFSWRKTESLLGCNLINCSTSFLCCSTVLCDSSFSQVYLKVEIFNCIARWNSNLGPPRCSQLRTSLLGLTGRHQPLPSSATQHCGDGIYWGCTDHYYSSVQPVTLTLGSGGIMTHCVLLYHALDITINTEHIAEAPVTGT